jgi:hypothetical protein
MCLGGPNHCRVGRAGSQSYLFSIDRHLMHAVTCCASYVILLCSSWFASCSSSGGDAESNVFISLVHARTHFKKKKKM